MAVFGLYRAREDDAARAVRAALAMLAGARASSTSSSRPPTGVRLRMRIGIDTGEVVVTGMAEREAGEFLVVGETANRAARLQAAAAPGTVLLSADTAGQVARRVRPAPGARPAAQGHRRPGRRLRRRRPATARASGRRPAGSRAW